MWRFARQFRRRIGVAAAELMQNDVLHEFKQWRLIGSLCLSSTRAESIPGPSQKVGLQTRAPFLVFSNSNSLPSVHYLVDGVIHCPLEVLGSRIIRAGNRLQRRLLLDPRRLWIQERRCPRVKFSVLSVGISGRRSILNSSDEWLPL